MGTWYLYESDGTTQITSTTEENLVYTFPQNPGSSDITYKVKYVDDSGCSGELTGGIKQDGCEEKPCDCEAITITENPVTFTIEGGEKVIGTVRSGCESAFNVQGNIPWFSVSLKDGNNIVVSAQTNTTEPNGRQAGVVLKINDNTCISPLMVEEEGGAATFNIYIYGTIKTYRPAGAQYDVYEIDLEYTRDDTGLPSANSYPLNILSKRMTYHYSDCNLENVAPQSVQLPVTHKICQGPSGDIATQPILDAADCSIAIAGCEKTLVANGSTIETFDCTNGNITFHIEFSLYKQNS